MDYRQEYEKWINSKCLNNQEKDELKNISNNEDELKSRFNASLNFGTGGLRGVLGLGTNRMNKYTVRQATQGMANLILREGKDCAERGVVIAHDCRNFSDEFSKEAACVLAGNGIKVYLFDELRPTPELSFSVLYLNCIAGINITASHNPKQYNGYKAYWEDGAQLSLEQADIVFDEIQKTDIFNDIKSITLEEGIKSGIIKMIGGEVDEAYLAKVMEHSHNREAVLKVTDSLKIIYTPFHGAGYKLVPAALKMLGIKNLIPVPEQMVIDGNFPTVKSPNPEEKEGFTKAIEIAKENDSDLIIGTDPDADRVGLVVRDNNGEYVALNGNQTGALLLDYILAVRKEKGILPANAFAVKTIVTSDIAKSICKSYNVKLMEVLTGFKFIGEKIKEFDETGKYKFVFGYEESYGYLPGTYARDKDAVASAVLVAEMASYYKLKGLSLYNALINIYEKYGWYSEKTVSVVMDDVDGLERMKALMDRIRNSIPVVIGRYKVAEFMDYSVSGGKNLATNEKLMVDLPKSNVLSFELEEGSKVVVRPSGTEPKVKLYIMAKDSSRENVDKKVAELETAAKELLR